MQVFKCALALVLRSPVMLLVYAVGLGFVGVLMGSSFTYGDTEGTYVRPQIDYAIIDRDNSELSRGISEFMETQGTRVEVEDTQLGMQDAVAKGDISYLLIIPEGYQSDFLDAITADTEAPQMDVVYSFYASEGFVLDGALANYMSALRTCIAAEMVESPSDMPEYMSELAAFTNNMSGTDGLGTDGLSDAGNINSLESIDFASINVEDITDFENLELPFALELSDTANVDIAQASAKALETATNTVETTIVSKGTYTVESDQFCFYLQFDSYVLFAAIISCLGILLGTLNRTDMRKRILSSPISYISCNVQTALACLVITVIVWIWILLLGFVFFPSSVAAISTTGLACMALITFVFALIPLAIAFLVGQTGLGIVASNAIGNILGLIVSFFGGAWIPLSLTAPEVNTLAHFLPGFWYTDALSQAAHLSTSDWSALAPIFGHICILLLFAAAIFCVGLVVGKLRTQTSEAGGNATGALSEVM